MVACNACHGILPRNLWTSGAEAERRRRGSVCCLPPQVFPSDWLERATVNYQYWRSKLDGEQEERTVRLKPAASTAASTFLSQLPEEGGA
jgi:hypothetical protein